MVDRRARSWSRVGCAGLLLLAVTVLSLVLVFFVAAASATFRGRDGELLVQAEAPGGRPQLWLTAADGRHARLIFTGGRCANFAGAQFLPSGKQVVVQESFGCGPFEWGLVLVDTNGRGSRLLWIANYLTAVIPGSVAISPDGQTLADGHRLGMKTEIDFVSLRSGGTVRSVMSRLLPPTAWLPTDHLVAVYPGGGIGIADLNGSHLRRIDVRFASKDTVLDTQNSLWIPSVVPSPDGSRFVVLGSRINSTCIPLTGPTGPVQCPSDLYLVSARGGRVRRLTHNGGELDQPPPVWSPDGSQLIIPSIGAINQALDVRTGRTRTIRVRVPGINQTILDWQAVPG